MKYSDDYKNMISTYNPRNVNSIGWKIEYLGLIIREGEVTMDPTKVQAVANWPTPRNLQELRGFLRFANFYHRFIKNFAKLARPLNDLTKKDA